MSAQDTPDIRRYQERLAAEGIDVVRVIYPDLIGTDRARDVLLDHLPSACDHGLAFCRAVYHTSPQGDVVPVAGGLDAGLPDVTVRPDLSTLAALPWEPGVAACLGEVTDPATGAPAAESPRDLLRAVLARCTEQGLHPVVGPELEYFLLEPAPGTPTGWRRAPETTGAVYTAGLRGDPGNHLLRTLRSLRDLGIGVVTGNHEFDGGQYEINLSHSDALDAADRAFRFKAAVKELARKEGKLATFMAKPFGDAGGSASTSICPAGPPRRKAPTTPSTTLPARMACPPSPGTPSRASSPTRPRSPRWPTPRSTRTSASDPTRSRPG